MAPHTRSMCRKNVSFNCHFVRKPNTMGPGPKMTYTQKKSGAKMVPQRSHFEKRPQRGLFCGQENGPSDEPFWLLFFSECTILSWLRYPHGELFSFITLFGPSAIFVICSLHRLYCKFCVIPKEELPGPHLGMTATKIFRLNFAAHVTWS